MEFFKNLCDLFQKNKENDFIFQPGSIKFSETKRNLKKDFENSLLFLDNFENPTLRCDTVILEIFKKFLVTRQM